MFAALTSVCFLINLVYYIDLFNSNVIKRPTGIEEFFVSKKDYINNNIPNYSPVDVHVPPDYNSDKLLARNQPKRNINKSSLSLINKYLSGNKREFNQFVLLQAITKSADSANNQNCELQYTQNSEKKRKRKKKSKQRSVLSNSHHVSYINKYLSGNNTVHNQGSVLQSVTRNTENMFLQQLQEMSLQNLKTQSSCHISTDKNLENPNQVPSEAVNIQNFSSDPSQSQVLHVEDIKRQKTELLNGKDLNTAYKVIKNLDKNLKLGVYSNIEDVKPVLAMDVEEEGNVFEERWLLNYDRSGVGKLFWFRAIKEIFE